MDNHPKSVLHPASDPLRGMSFSPREDIDREVQEFCDEVMPLFERHSNGALFYFNDQLLRGTTDVSIPTPTASCTKSVVAIAIFKAYQLGYLDIDKSITSYLRDADHFPSGQFGQITTRHLLTHTSGMPGNLYFLPKDKSRDIPGDQQFHADRASELDRNVRAALWPLQYEVGKTYDYSNPGTQILEAVLFCALKDAGCDLTVEEFIHKYVFNPLGMKNTTLLKDGSVVMFNGGMASTAEDLAKLGRFILKAGSPESDSILPFGLLREMISSPEGISGASPRYGHLWQKVHPGTIAAIGDCANSVFVLPEENIVISRTHPIVQGELSWKQVRQQEQQREQDFWRGWERIYRNFRDTVVLKEQHPLSDVLTKKWEY
jgi:CubicO group peptidase (beta-lactamase class C family)